MNENADLLRSSTEAAVHVSGLALQDVEGKLLRDVTPRPAMVGGAAPARPWPARRAVASTRLADSRRTRGSRPALGHPRTATTVLQVVTAPLDGRTTLLIRVTPVERPGEAGGRVHGPTGWVSAESGGVLGRARVHDGYADLALDTDGLEGRTVCVRYSGDAIHEGSTHLVAL